MVGTRLDPITEKYTTGYSMRIRCVWSYVRVYTSRKRKAITILCSILIVAFLMNWRLSCISIQPESHVGNLCSDFENRQSNGHLCEALCQSEFSISCLNIFVEKGAVLSGLWMNKSIIFKSLKLEHGNTLNSTVLEKKFVDVVKKVVRKKFNLSINDIDANRMISKNGEGRRYVQQRGLWLLIHDNEYLALSLYGKYNVFPKFHGTCGSLYAVERLNSISGYWHLIYDTQAEWAKRVKISIMILDLLLKLEEKFPEPMLICDMQLKSFGVTNDFKKVKYIDLASVHPLSVANRIIADGSDCKHHSDCDLLDCRSFCNLITYKCQHGVVNNNLQIVCEKIFLGWVMSGRIVVSGLLMGSRTPDILIEILEKCANPYNEYGIPRAQATKEIRKRLYNFLVHFM